MGKTPVSHIPLFWGRRGVCFLILCVISIALFIGCEHNGSESISGNSISIPEIGHISGSWQRYRIRVVIKIGGIRKLWMPVPREWDGSSVFDGHVFEVFPTATDRYSDADGNEIVYWRIQDQSTREYGMVFEISVRPVTYHITPSRIGTYDTTSSLYQRYTRPSPLCQSDAPEIVSQAQKVVGSETNPFQQAQLLQHWIATNIKPDDLAEHHDALTTLHTRRGQCSGFSSLFIALSRALGIPARNISGWHYPYQGYFTSGVSSTFQQGGNFYQHVWSEFYLPKYGWIQFDPFQNFATINEERIITAKGDEIQLGYGYPGAKGWFHIPVADTIGQVLGEDYRLEVERL